MAAAYTTAASRPLRTVRSSSASIEASESLPPTNAEIRRNAARTRESPDPAQSAPHPHLSFSVFSKHSPPPPSPQSDSLGSSRSRTAPAPPVAMAQPQTRLLRPFV